MSANRIRGVKALLVAMIAVAFVGSVGVVAWQAPLVHDQIVADD